MDCPDAFCGGVMLGYALAGVYVWWLGLPWGRRWLALLLMILLWPVFLMDADFKHQPTKRTR